MKKAGIITHYNVHNHGAQLQLFALAKVLGEMGYEAKALQFVKNYDFFPENASKKYNISLRSIPLYIKYLVQNGLIKTVYNIKKRHLLNSFRTEYNLNGEYYSRAEDLDLVVVGSDEVFSIEAGLTPCFFGFGVKALRTIAYAGSFGPTTLSLIKEKNALNYISGGLKNFDSISVRDQNSQLIVKSIIGVNPSIVCDPVLLFDIKKYSSKQLNKKTLPPKYCIVYSYDYNMNDADTVEAIKRYAKERGLKIVSVGYYHSWCDLNIQVTPLELFCVFSSASMVFTDTFHGTVLSIASSSQFFVKVTTNTNKLGFLLEQYELIDRRVMHFSEVFSVTKIIDYSEKQILIEKIRKDSRLYLEKALQVVCYDSSEGHK